MEYLYNHKVQYRLSIIHTGLHMSFDRLKEADKRNKKSIDFDFKIKDIAIAIGETLFWLIALEDWLLEHSLNYKSNKKERIEEKNYLLGLKHAYNATKHDMSYVHLFTFRGKEPIAGDGSMIKNDLESDIIWIECPDNPKKINQVNNYRRYIKNQLVISVFEKTIDFLNQEVQEFKQNSYS